MENKIIQAFGLNVEVFNVGPKPGIEPLKQMKDIPERLYPATPEHAFDWAKRVVRLKEKYERQISMSLDTFLTMEPAQRDKLVPKAQVDPLDVELAETSFVMFYGRFF